MEIIHTSEFEKIFEKLPQDAKRLYNTQEKRFRANWQDARLHIKKLKGLDGVFSFRITRRYRVLFYFHKTNAAIFFEVDHRKDIYRR